MALTPPAGPFKLDLAVVLQIAQAPPGRSDMGGWVVFVVIVGVIIVVVIYIVYIVIVVAVIDHVGQGPSLH